MAKIIIEIDTATMEVLKHETTHQGDLIIELTAKKEGI